MPSSCFFFASNSSSVMIPCVLELGELLQLRRVVRRGRSGGWWRGIRLLLRRLARRMPPDPARRTSGPGGAGQPLPFPRRPRVVAAARTRPPLRRNISSLLCGCVRGGGEHVLARLHDAHRVGSDRARRARRRRREARPRARAAQTSSQSSIAAEEFGSSSAAASIRSSSPRNPLPSSPSASRPRRTSSSRSLSSNAATSPSASLPTNARSMIRIVFDSTSFASAGRDLACESVPGERHDHVLDWSESPLIHSRSSFYESAFALMRVELRLGDRAAVEQALGLLDLGGRRRPSRRRSGRTRRTAPAAARACRHVALGHARAR